MIMQKRNIKPEKFEDRIIFMSMFNDIDCTRRGNEDICPSNAEKDVREDFLAGTLDVPGSWKRQEVLWRMQLHT